MKKTTLVGIVFAVLVLGYLVVSSFQKQAFRCQVCITYNGGRNCATGAAQTEMQAQRTATMTACAQLASGITDSNQCENTPPDKLEWLSGK
jgi:hypothetical protein